MSREDLVTSAELLTVIELCQRVVDRFPHPDDATEWAKGRRNLALEILKELNREQ